MNKKENVRDINDEHIFIVEDNDMHSLAIDYLLSNQTTAHINRYRSGEECMQNIGLKPDVVILDYGLPGMNGMQTLIAIKEYDPEIPIVVITASHDKQIARKFLNAGVYDYIEKDDDGFEEASKTVDRIIGAIGHKRAIKQSNKVIILLGWLVCVAVIVITWILSKR